jgi:tetratricopeptide (TPR) repeat protein
MGEKALLEGRPLHAREPLRRAVALVQVVGADDLEEVDLLRRLSMACRQLGALGEARARLTRAARLLSRERLRADRAGRSFRQVVGSYLLERARLESAAGDFVAAQAAALEFLALRGPGGDPAESAAAHVLLGELLLARGLTAEAQAEFRLAGPLAATLTAGLRERLLLRTLEADLEQGRLDRAQALVAATPIPASASRSPGWLLVLARLDVSEQNFEAAATKLEAALQRLASDERLAPGSLASPALTRLQRGSALVAVGRELLAGEWRATGWRSLQIGRRAVADVLADRDHFALVRADLELAIALAAVGRLEPASERCRELLEMGQRLPKMPRSEQLASWIACGRIEVERGAIGRARALFLDGLDAADDPLDRRLRLELLVRLAALAHLERATAVETKLFERVLPLTPGAFDHLERLLIDTYRGPGSVAASAAAARIAHTAACQVDERAAAPELQALAMKLSAKLPGAASLRR